MRARNGLVLALLGAWPFHLQGCDRADPTEERPNIVLLTVDTLRADHLGCYGHRPGGVSPSPFLDSLAARGMVFERAFAPRGQTHPSLASMLTGLHPITHGLRDNGQSLRFDVDTLPALLKRAGYATAGFASNLARDRWDFWLRGFDVAEDGTRGRLMEEGGENGYRFQRVWDERVTQDAIEFVRGRADSDQPFFLWVHLFDVHAPYTPDPADAEPFLDPSYRGALQVPGDGQTGDPVSSLIESWTLGRERFDAADLRRVHALYDGGVLGCDRKLERIHEALAEHDLLENTLVILTSDHGEELADHHDYFGHGCSIYDSVLRIPLVFAWPGKIAPGGRSDGLAQILDVFPTVLQAAGLDVPPECEGESLLPVLLGERTATGRRYVYAEWEDLVYAVSDGDWKLIANPAGARPKKPPYHLGGPDAAFPLLCFELYRVSVDPRETTNLFDKGHPEARRLNFVLRQFLAAHAHRRPMVLMDPDPSDLGALMQLGYIGSTSADRGIVTIDCDEDGG